MIGVIWDIHFGRLANQGHTLAIGEFGGRYQGQDQVWQDAFVNYLLDKGISAFFYWSLNANSGDTGGILKDDWKTVDQGKLMLLQRLIAGASNPLPQPEPESESEPELSAVFQRGSSNGGARDQLTADGSNTQTVVGSYRVSDETLSIACCVLR